MVVEPVMNERAAIATADGQRLLIIADYHAGVEAVLRSDGVEIASQAESRRERLLGLIAGNDIDRLVILGDLVHAIGDPWDSEREEIEALVEQLSVPVTLIKGNHDGEIEGLLDELDHETSISSTSGARIGDIGFAHGHTWPNPSLFETRAICVGHEHPVIRLEDSVGGSRIEPAWLRGTVDPSGFQEQYGEQGNEPELIVFPAFNELSGGTWINVDGQEFLSPFLPQGLADGEAYLLDGTRLGDFRAV